MANSEVGAWDGLVVVCAANNYDGIKLADQHFAEQLSKLVPVLYVDPPVSSLAPLKKPRMARRMLGSRIRILAPGLARLTPVVEPFPSKRLLTGITARLVRAYLRGVVARLGVGQVEAVISAWPLFPVFGTCQERVQVYWAQDDFVGVPPSWVSTRSILIPANVVSQPRLTLSWQQIQWSPITGETRCRCSPNPVWSRCQRIHQCGPGSAGR